MELNKGEWSELYCILYLLVNRKLKLVDHKLKLITDNIFEVQNVKIIKRNGDIHFNVNDNYVFPVIFNNKISPINIYEVDKFKQELFENIENDNNKTGSFSIEIAKKWLKKHNIDYNYKSASNLKEDVFLLNLDINRKIEIELGYSLKSKIGSPATLLNASNHTNFKYKVVGLKQEYIDKINNINTKTKLKDRIQEIIKLGGKINFASVPSKTFLHNLKMIDALLPEVLGEVILNSYTTGNKDLKILFEKSTIYKNNILANKKLEDFLLASSFDMFPSILWDGKQKITGGIIIVNIDSEVYVLDMIYYKNELKKYLLNETKLDSPSSSRYNMLNLKIENKEIYFTLNLQIRYKS